jgi:hypothetical protein
MDIIIRSQLSDNRFKKQYAKPQIVQEVLLETKAGSQIQPTEVGTGFNESFTLPGDFTINTEP